MLSGLRRAPELVACVALAAGLLLIAFVAPNGIAYLGANTWTEIVLACLGCAAAVAVALRGARGPAWGLPALAAFVAATALEAISMAWSVTPDSSWIEAGRMAGYLGAFTIALALARLMPARWRVLVGGLALFAVALSAWAVLVKVFPSALDSGDQFGRLSAPSGYWNTTGTTAAIGLPACLWLGARRGGRTVTRGLAVPAVGLLISVVALSYSRSAALAALAGVGLWLALSPSRRRGTVVLVLGGIGGAVISAWALHSYAFAHDHVPLATRVSGGRSFGVVLVVALGALVPAGYYAVKRMDSTVLSERIERLVKLAPRAGMVLLPLLVVGALAASSRGLTGEVSHVFSTLTSTTQGVGDNPNRLASLANSRPLYWREALTVGRHAPVAGVGAGGFQTAQKRYPNDTAPVAQAHSYVIQTFADLGAIGLAVNLVLLLAWGVAAARTVGRGRSPVQDRARENTIGALEPERAGMVTLLAAVVAFGASSSIDWTWYFPGLAVPALACAGWLAGRGPLEHPVGIRAGSRAGTRGRLVALGGLLAAVLLAWAIWQPLRSVDADNAAMSALLAGDGGAALGDARAAASEDPVAWVPLWDESIVYAALGQNALALGALRDAVNVQPENPQPWYWLGEFELTHGRARDAVAALTRSHELDVLNAATSAALATASSARAS